MYGSRAESMRVLSPNRVEFSLHRVIQVDKAAQVHKQGHYKELGREGLVPVQVSNADRLQEE
jgi:hypothetical protein